MKKEADNLPLGSGARGVAGGISQEEAETLAINALTFLASEPERLDRFLSLSGLSPENLRAAAASPGFLAAVLNHLAQDETLLLSFAAHMDCDPKLAILARDRLDPPAWENP